MGARRCCRRSVVVGSLCAVGVLMLIAGGVLIPEFPKIIRNKINENVVIKKDSQAYDEWRQPTSSFYMSYYVFDLQNEQEVFDGKRPNVTQRGPYTYREIRNNDAVEWEDEGNVLTYLQYKAYVFDSSRSCAGCTDNDTVTTPNVPMLTLINQTLTSNVLIQLGLLSLFEETGVTLFHKLTVKQVLFGYNDTLLLFLKNVEENKLVQDLLKLLEMFDPALAAKIPLINPLIQLQYNGTAGENMTGNITILTGKDDINQVQVTKSWKGQTALTFWNSSYGNMINGTDGTHFMPNPSKTDRLYIFVTDICRSLYLNYNSQTKLKGIELQKYTTIPALFQNASTNEENRPYCVPKCFAAGLLPIGQCLPMNPPILMSGPHFYQGAPELVDNIIGMHPNEKLHGTFLHVEPYTGLTMKAAKRLQANVHIVSAGNYKVITKKTREMFYPIMYIEEHGEISDADATKFKTQVYKAITISLVVQYGLIGLGGLLILISIGVAVRGRKKKVLINEDSSERSRLLGNGQENNYS